MMRKLSIKEIVDKNNGVVLSSDVDQIGAHRGSLKYLVDSGRMERVARGVYVRPDAWVDDLFILQNRFARGIYSCETALFLHGMSDRTPMSWTMTFPAHYNTVKAEAAGVVCHQKSLPLYEQGVVQVRSPYGADVRVYSREVTLCDILRPRNHVEVQVAADAFRAYVKSGKCDLTELSRMARLFHVETKLRTYMEVLV